MSNVLEIESAISRLPLVEQQVIRDWLDDQIEGQLAVSEGFKAKIERAQRELAEGIQSRERRAASLLPGLRRRFRWDPATLMGASQFLACGVGPSRRDARK